jgi:ATP-binding protein involved in chromosome partitioning
MQNQTKKEELLPGVKSVIAVASGKGGVGKSTTAVNLALALSNLGHRVGILDADIYGPSLPRLLGLFDRPDATEDKKLIPLEKYGLKCFSIGFMIAEAAPLIWRGPMVQSALTQLIRDVAWGELDYLVLDLPPGTGDVQLTLSQLGILTGVVIVSTPQDLALIDAHKALQMFRKVDVPVLGIIENMSVFVCPNCGHSCEIFSHGGARDEATKMELPFLGEVPLRMDIRTASDAGSPITLSDPSVYGEIAERLLEQVALNSR